MAVELPDHLQVTEKVRFDAALAWLNIVNDAEERTFASTGRYSPSLHSIDDHITPLKDFSLIGVALSSGTSRQWAVTLRRKPLLLGHCPIFGCYDVTYKSLPGSRRRQDHLPGFFTCSNSACTDSLLPR